MIKMAWVPGFYNESNPRKDKANTVYPKVKRGLTPLAGHPYSYPNGSISYWGFQRYDVDHNLC